MDTFIKQFENALKSGTLSQEAKNLMEKEREKLKNNDENKKSSSPSASKTGESEQERQKKEKLKEELRNKEVRGTGYSAMGAEAQKSIALANPTEENVKNAEQVIKTYRPTALKADRDINIKEDVEEAEETKKEEKPSPAPVASSNKTTIDYTDPALRGFNEQREKVTNMTDEEKEKLNKRIDDINESMESKVDTNYIENLPRSVWRAMKEGRFGRVEVDKDVLEKYNAIKDIPESELTDEQKQDLANYNQQKKEVSRSRSQAGYFLIDNLFTGLGNWASIIKGGAGDKKSKYDEVLSSQLGGALERYNKKYADIANSDADLLLSAYKTDQDIDNQLKKVYAEKSVQPYLTRLDLNNRKIFVNYIAAMGKNIDFKELPGLLAGLMLYQDTGTLAPQTLNMLESAGSGVMGLIKAIL